MALFRFTSPRHPGEAVEFFGADVSATLEVASRIHFAEADLSEAGKYLLTFRKEEAPGGPSGASSNANRRARPAAKPKI
jgi:hypothetical protein